MLQCYAATAKGTTCPRQGARNQFIAQGDSLILLPPTWSLRVFLKRFFIEAGAFPLQLHLGRTHRW